MSCRNCHIQIIRVPCPGYKVAPCIEPIPAQMEEQAGEGEEKHTVQSEWREESQGRGQEGQRREESYADIPISCFHHREAISEMFPH